MLPWAVVRLYVPMRFEVGQRVLLPAAELRYFQTVRRGQGPVALFNREGQVAFGAIEGESFVVDKVDLSMGSVLNLRVALALPESPVVFQLVRQLSELGVKALSLFGGERSQKSKSRLSEDFHKRLEKIAIESCRQSGRSIPLEIDLINFIDLKGATETNRFLFDEVDSPLLKAALSDGSTLFVVGCEGGWSQSERDRLVEWGFKSVHWPTPVLRVDTAAVASVGWYLAHMPSLGG